MTIPFDVVSIAFIKSSIGTPEEKNPAFANITSYIGQKAPIAKETPFAQSSFGPPSHIPGEEAKTIAAIVIPVAVFSIAFIKSSIGTPEEKNPVFANITSYIGQNAPNAKETPFAQSSVGPPV